MYIAMNRFQIIAGKEAEFEAAWKDRDSFLQGVPGFKEFHLLKGDEGVYISHSVWDNRETFINWTESEAFQKAHAQGGSRGLVAGPPQFSGYQVVL